MFSISAVASLVSIPVGFSSSVLGLKICVVAVQVKVSKISKISQN